MGYENPYQLERLNEPNANNTFTETEQSSSTSSEEQEGSAREQDQLAEGHLPTET